MSEPKPNKQDETRRLARIIEGAQVGTWEWNVQTGETVFNDRWAAILGYTLEELSPVSIETWKRLTHPDDLAKSNRALARHFNGETPWYDCEARMRHKDGHWVWIHDRGKVITRTDDGAPLMMFGTHLDISQSKRAEASLRASEQKYRALFDQSLLGIYLHDLEGRIIEVNDMACAQSGYSREELLERSVFDNFPNVSSNNLPREQIMAQWKSWRPGERFIFPADHERKDGTVYPVEISTGTVAFDDTTHVVAIVQDITERKRTEETLTTIQRLESLGVLAGGIAHDFNNLLSGIFGFLDLAMDACTDPTASDYLENAVKSITRARALTQQLLTFSRGGEPVKRVSRLFPFVEETANFALSGTNVSCRVSAPTDLWSCDIDKHQISQVIDNVMINAQQATPSGGVVEVSAENCSVAPPGDGVLAPGRYVEIAFQDRGVGIPKEIISRVFEPFYTTKTKGHGLGLAMCYSIVKRHGGHIAIASEPGQGTTVRLHLPAASDAIESSTKPQQHTRHKGDGVILVMDDDTGVLETTGHMLRRFGYEMIAAPNGEAAIEVFSKQRQAGVKLRAMIFDLTVSGGMGGKEAIRRIRDVDTDIPVFVCSGYADDPVMARPGEYGFNASLAKPFRIAALSRLLNEHLKKG